MALPEFTMRQLLEAGVHFGHQTQRWNPKMQEFIYGGRNGIHIMDLTQTVPMLDAALDIVQKTVAKGGRILFVGTKRQAQTPIKEAAEKSAQFYMNHRWLGGTLTNWQTVSKSIQRLKNIIDVNKEDLAIAEANKLGIPVVAVVDTNCSPDGIDYIIPGNDDAARAIALYTDLAARAALDGMTAQMGAAGIDIGEMEASVEEEVAAEAPAAEAAPAEDAPAES